MLAGPLTVSRRVDLSLTVAPWWPLITEFMAGSPWYQTFGSETEEPFTYSNVYFRVASKRRIYSLDPYKILDLLGDMGGLLDIINAFGVLVTVSVVKEAFNRSLLGDAYQV